MCNVKSTWKLYLHKNSQTVKKGAAHAKKAAWRKVMKSKVAAQIHKFTWVIVIKNFAIIRLPQPLLGRHLWFHNFFHAAFLHGPHLFLQFGCFCVDFTSFCNLTNLCFVAGGWTAYWMTWLQMNCTLGDLDLAELYTGWLGSGWTVYWVTLL